MDEAAAMQAFVEHMLTYTIRLLRAKPNEWPFGIASGFIIPVTSALMMSGYGLFQAESVGRILFTDVWGEAVNWTPHFGHPDPEL